MIPGPPVDHSIMHMCSILYSVKMVFGGVCLLVPTVGLNVDGLGVVAWSTIGYTASDASA